MRIVIGGAVKTIFLLLMLGASIPANAVSVNWPTGPVSPTSPKQCRNIGTQYDSLLKGLYAKRGSNFAAIQTRNKQLIAQYGSSRAQDKMEHSKHSTAPACSGGDTYGYPSNASVQNKICEAHNRKSSSLHNCYQKVRGNTRGSATRKYHSAAAARSASIYTTSVASEKVASNSYIYRKVANISNKVMIANSFLELSSANTRAEKQSALTSLAKHTGNYSSRGNLLSSTALSIAFSYLQSVQEKAYSDFYSSWQSFDQEYASISKASLSYGAKFAPYYSAYNNTIEFNKSVYGNMNSLAVNRHYLDVVEPKFIISQDYLAQQETIRQQRVIDARTRREEAERITQRTPRERDANNGNGLFDVFVDVMGAAASTYIQYKEVENSEAAEGSECNETDGSPRHPEFCN